MGESMNDARVKTCQVCDEIYAVASGHSCVPVEDLPELPANMAMPEGVKPPSSLTTFQREQVRRIVREEIELHTRRIMGARKKIV
jgi:hypothetical protein